MNAISEKMKPADSCLALNGRQLEGGIWVLLLVACNYSLVWGEVAERLIFVPQLVANGEWSRLFFSPFVHVSWYHLVLDATAFLLLWNGLLEKSWRGRLLFFTCCWLGSVAVPLLFSENIYAIGLCGLSGIAHGLFVITALEMIFAQKDKQSRNIGLVLLAGVAVKVWLELFSGGAIIANLHFGDIGQPIFTSHLGGLIGGGFAFLARYYLSTKTSATLRE